MEFTGERMIIGQTDKELEWEHLDRYYFVKQFVKDKSVLDVACGSGYGAAILSHNAKIVHGVDISKDAVDYATAMYGSEKVVFHEASATKLPFEAEMFDVVVSFETIEHISGEEQNCFLKEVLRVLKKEGVFIVSTPNREVYDERGENHFHKKELSYLELRILLESKFENVSILTQQWEVSDVIVGENLQDASVVSGIQCEQAEYLIAVCANMPIEQMSYQIRVRGDRKLRSLMRWAVENHERNEANNVLIRELQAQQGSLRSEAERLVQEKQNALGEVSQLRDKENMLLGQLGNANNEVQQLRDKENMLLGQLRNANNEVQQLRDKENTLLGQLGNANNEVQQLRDKENTLLSQLGNAQNEVQQLRDKENVLKRESEALSERILEQKRERQAVEKKLQQTEEQLHSKENLLRDKEDELEAVKYELACREGECQQLRDKENRLKNDLEATRNSRTWKLARIFAGFVRFFVPVGSKRALFLRLLWTFIKHPIKFLKNLSPRKIKKFFRLLRKGNVEGIKMLINSNLNGQPAPSMIELTTPEIVPVEMATVQEKTAADYPVLNVPQWDAPQVSIIIPVYNQFEFTYHCVESVIKNSGDVTYEIIIANDCSTDLTTQIDSILPGVRCITNEKNLRFLLNCNNAARYAKGQYVLFLNNDTQVQPDWLKPLVTLIESADDIGMVGSKLIYPDGLLQEAGGILWKDGSAWNYGNRQNPALPQFNYVKQVDYISGAAIMLSRALWEEIGGFDETFVPAYCEDSDLAFTVRKMGYRVMYQPLSVVVHFEGVSNGTDTSSGQKHYQVVNSEKFREKWAEELAKHPENGVDVFTARDCSYNKRTVLMIDHYVPMYDKDAGSRTIYQYIKLLVEMGYNVKFIGDNFFAHQPYTTVLEQMGVEVLYGVDYMNNWKSWVDENANKLDVVFMNRPHISEKYIDYIRQHTNAKIIYNLCDLHFLREQREYELTGDKSLKESAEQWKPRELALVEKADRAFSLSSDEQRILNQYFPEEKTVICPIFIYDNFVDELPKRLGTKDLLFVGGFSHNPNVDAMEWFCSEVFPQIRERIPDIRLHIVGSNAPASIQKYQSEHIILEGFVTDERLQQLYQQCRVCVIPLRYGAGVKGKTIEAMYNGIPIVTTRIGIEGLPEIEKCVSAHNDADSFAAQVVNVYCNGDGGSAQRCYNFVRNHYSRDSAKAFFTKEF